MSKVIALVALACLALGVVWSLQAITGVRTYDQVVTSDPWGERASFSYVPLHADGSGPFPMGEPGYFTHEAHTTRIHFVWQLEDETAQRVTALGTMKLLVQHEASGGYASWTYSESLTNTTFSGPSSGQLAMESLLDFVAISRRVEATPGHQVDGSVWSVTAQVRFASAPRTDHAADASAFELPISYTAPLYVFPAPATLVSTKDHTDRETSHHADPGGISALIDNPAGPILLLAGLAGLSGALPILSRPEGDAT